MNDQTTSFPPIGESSSMGAESSQYEGIKTQAEGKLEQGKEQVKRLGSQARDRAIGLADERKGEVSSKLSVIAESLDHFCSELEEKGVPAQQILGKATQYLREFSSEIDTRSTQELLQRVESRFHRSPAPFLAGCFALGFFGARLLRS